MVSTDGYQQATAAGTGIVLTSTGEVLTNNHVIEGATSIKVTDIGNGKSYTATVVGYDATQDVAVLHLQGASGLTTASLGDSATVQAGDRVVALGNAEGKGGTPSVATGMVTALNQSIIASDGLSGVNEQLSGLIESNARIKPGDSGGPAGQRLRSGDRDGHRRVLGVPIPAPVRSGRRAGLFDSGRPSPVHR